MSDEGMIGEFVLCGFLSVALLGVFFEVFTTLLYWVIGDSDFYAKSNSTESEPMTDDGYINAAMYLSMHDE